ncbi:hypothetical protein HGRIS_010981 [Hohenbuehelia grisea]|uniref:Uncharacterized protein n=1 Tax=Hohenbuehelia grisea TaxID=104357 RepID=A0ABR3IYP9_9AGAR
MLASVTSLSTPYRKMPSEPLADLDAIRLYLVALTGKKPHPGTPFLQDYMAKATLPLMRLGDHAPSMPPPGRRSQLNILAAPRGSSRELRELKRLPRKTMHDQVEYWLRKSIPTGHMILCAPHPDPKTGEYFTVPSKSYDVSDPLLRRPDAIRGVMNWLDNIPLMTVQHILHIVYPHETAEWRFIEREDTDSNSKIFNYFVWDSLTAHFGDVHGGPRPLLLACQPPWVLSPRDMTDFVECKWDPYSSTISDAYRAPGAADNTSQKVWAKLWDACTREDCHWFVLTSYNQWVFRCFSADRQTGFCSSIYECDCSDPTILQMLTFWVACAVGLPRAFQLPQARQREWPINNPHPVCTEFSGMEVESGEGSSRASVETWVDALERELLDELEKTPEASDDLSSECTAHENATSVLEALPRVEVGMTARLPPISELSETPPLPPVVHWGPSIPRSESPPSEPGSPLFSEDGLGDEPDIDPNQDSNLQRFG